MNVTELNDRNYRNAWKALNDRLNALSTMEGGLPAALQYLEQQQFDQGFIQDDLRSVERYRLCDSSDRAYAFTVQFNPKRALRQAGAGRTTPPPGVTAINNNCFLCAENIRWQQRGIELGYEFSIGDSGKGYIAWMNPFPLMPTHTTIATQAHVPQSWLGADDTASGENLRAILGDFLEITRQLPGFIGFYNGEGAGATIPSHFHFQFFRRPEGQEFLLEKMARVAMAESRGHVPLVIRRYPIRAMYFSGSKEDVIAGAGAWAQRWAHYYGNSPALSANMIATLNPVAPDLFNLYFIPRNRSYSRAPGMAGLVGGLEVLGELVFSTEAEKQQIVAGQVKFRSVAAVLSSVEAPGVDEFLDSIAP